MFKKGNNENNKRRWEDDPKRPWRKNLTPNQQAVAQEQEYLENLRLTHDTITGIVQGVVMLGVTIGGGAVTANLTAKALSNHLTLKM